QGPPGGILHIDLHPAGRRPPCDVHLPAQCIAQLLPSQDVVVVQALFARIDRVQARERADGEPDHDRVDRDDDAEARDEQPRDVGAAALAEGGHGALLVSGPTNTASCETRWPVASRTVNSMGLAPLGALAGGTVTNTRKVPTASGRTARCASEPL